MVNFGIISGIFDTLQNRAASIEKDIKEARAQELERAVTTERLRQSLPIGVTGDWSTAGGQLEFKTRLDPNDPRLAAALAEIQRATAIRRQDQLSNTVLEHHFGILNSLVPDPSNPQKALANSILDDADREQNVRLMIGSAQALASLVKGDPESEKLLTSVLGTYGALVAGDKDYSRAAAAVRSLPPVAGAIQRAEPAPTDFVTQRLTKVFNRYQNPDTAFAAAKAVLGNTVPEERIKELVDTHFQTLAGRVGEAQGRQTSAELIKANSELSPMFTTVTEKVGKREVQYRQITQEWLDTPMDASGSKYREFNQIEPKASATDFKVAFPTLIVSDDGEKVPVATPLSDVAQDIEKRLESFRSPRGRTKIGTRLPQEKPLLVGGTVELWVDHIEPDGIFRALPERLRGPITRPTEAANREQALAGVLSRVEPLSAQGAIEVAKAYGRTQGVDVKNVRILLREGAPAPRILSSVFGPTKKQLVLKVQ